MSQRTELLALAANEDGDGIVTFLKNAKADGHDLVDTLAECSQQNRELLWENLRKLCTSVLMGGDLENNVDQDQDKKARNQALLNCIVTLASATLQLKDTALPQALLDTGAILHGVLLTLPGELDDTKYRLAQLFESWWRHNLPGWEEVVSNTFFYLLKKSLDKGTIAEVKAVSSMRSVLALMNLDAPNTSDLKVLLGRCYSSAEFLKIDEGQRFLGYLMSLNSGLVELSHRAIKNQIPFAPKSWLSLYGDVYFRAWQKSTGDICEKIENDCIQDLMNHAIHANRGGSCDMSAILFRVLNQFHRQKKQRKVDAMLLKLYNPILWRALTVPNSEVRANSACILLDAFPLQDPSSSAEDTDTLIQKQFDFMQRLLVDPCPAVRALTAEGVCRVMSDYLEMIPAEVIQSLLCRLLKELAWDTSSPSVRAAVVKGVSSMLDNPLCHGLLKPLLPGLSLCLHDKSETVRVAVVNLLLKVKSIRSIKYWNITPVEHLLSRLEGDSQPVVRRLVELLFSSFLPLDRSPQEQVSRCVTLLESNPSAARVFFLSACRHLTLTDTVKYMSLLCRYVLESVRMMQQSGEESDHDTNVGAKKSKERGGKKSRKEKTEGGGGDDDDEEDEESEEDDANDDDKLTPELLQGLLETIFLMWTTVAKELDAQDNMELKQSIMKKLSVTVPEVLKVTQDAKIISLVLEIAGRLPPKSVPTISRSCMSKLRNMAEESKEGDCMELLEAMCLWKMAPQVLELLSDWLEDSLCPAEAPPPAQKKTEKKGKKCVQIAVPEEEKHPQLALRHLNTMLRSAVCRRILITDHHSLLLTLNKLLSHVTVIVEKHLEKGDAINPDTSAFLQTTFSLYLRLNVLLNKPDEDDADCLADIKDILVWGETKVVPFLPEISGEKDGVRQRDPPGVADSCVHLATTCIKSMLMMCSNMLMLGLGDEELVSQLVSFCLPVLRRDCSLAVLEEAMGCVQQLVLFEDLDVAQPVTQYLAHIISALPSHLSHPSRPIGVKVLNAVKNKLSGVVRCVLNNYLHFHSHPSQEKDVTIVTELTRNLLSAMLTELQHASEQDNLTEKIGDGQQDPLPAISTCLLACYTRSTPCHRLLVEEMEKAVKSQDVSDVHMVHAIVHLFTVIARPKGSQHHEIDTNSLQSFVNTLVQHTCRQSPGDHQMDEDIFRDLTQTIQTKLQAALGQS